MNTCTTSHPSRSLANLHPPDPETGQRLNFLATQTGRSKAFYLRELIETGLDDLEDYYLAADVLERVRKGRERLHSAELVRADLGLGG